MTKKRVLTILFSLLCTFSVFAQNNAINVSNRTGSLSVDIPMLSINKGKMSLPINLSYFTKGFKPKDIEGTAGMGWTLQSGGEISRKINGLPDDLSDAVTVPNLKGWMTSGAYAAINNFTISNLPGSFTDCTQQNADDNVITTNFPYNNDSEPDDFYVNAPGLSCHLVYDRASSLFRPVAYQDLTITYQTLGGTDQRKASLIKSFTITNDKGIKYVFAAPESLSQIARATGTPAYFTNKYNQYKGVGVFCYSAWNLTSITDISGSGFKLIYTAAPARKSTDKTIVYTRSETSSTVIVNELFSMAISAVNQVLTSIKTITSGADDDEAVVLLNWTSYTAANQTGQTILNSLSGNGHHFVFNYNFAANNTLSHNRGFLVSVEEVAPINGVDQPIPNSPFRYAFDYTGLNEATYTMEDSTTTKMDYWGYYNGSLNNAGLIPKVKVNPSNNAIGRYFIYSSSNLYSAYSVTTTMGYDRSPATSGYDIGTLNKITYATGGSSTIAYEPNDYRFTTASIDQIGGGIRVKSVVDHDGINEANNIVHNYYYKASLTSTNSSGRLLSLPQYAFTRPYLGSPTFPQGYWDVATVLSAEDLSSEDHSVLYNYVREETVGAGSTVYEYYNPATAFDAGQAPSCTGCTTQDWAPTINLFARAGCGDNNDWAVDDAIYSYPFIPNLNYDMERGLIKKITRYNSAATPLPVSETNYSYERLPPSYITAFKWDQISSVFATNSSTIKSYNKYNIYFNTGELTTTTTEKVYDSQTLSVAKTTTKTVTYNSTHHKVNKLSITNDDNAVYNSYYSYVNDYSPSASSTDPNIKALYNLKSQKMNLPVETYQEVVRTIGGVPTAKTISGSLLLWKPAVLLGVNVGLPAQQLKFLSPSGTPNFTGLNVSGASAAWYTGYYTTTNFSFYDQFAIPQTLDDGNRNIKTTLLDHIYNVPVAEFSNAEFDEVGYTNFESDLGQTGYNFSITGTGVNYIAGRNSNGYNLTSSQTLAKTVNRNVLAANYVVSLWIKAANGVTGAIGVKLNNVAQSNSINYTGNGNWRYYEVKYPTGALGATINFVLSSATSVSVDDVLLYPDVAEVTTTSYDFAPGFVNSKTNTNGKAVYYSNDRWGRVIYAYDQDKNIIQKNTYVNPGQVEDFNDAGFFYASSGDQAFSYVNQPTDFSITGFSSYPVNGIVIDWTFGDGATASTSWQSPPSHTYTTLGTKTVTAAIKSPIFGTKNISRTINVTSAPVLSIPINYTNTTTQAAITNVSFTPIGAGTTYSFTGSELSTASIDQGSYTIQVTLSGAKHWDGVNGYNSVTVNGSCQNWTSANTNNSYTFSKNLTSATSVDFVVSKDACVIVQ